MALKAQCAMCYCQVIMLGGSATAGVTICVHFEERAEVKRQSALTVGIHNLSQN